MHPAIMLSIIGVTLFGTTKPAVAEVMAGDLLAIAIQEWESQQPSEVVLQKITSGPFPLAETAIAAGPHADDRAEIVQLLRSGATADIRVEFEVSDVRNEIHAEAVEQGHRFLSDDQLAKKRAAYAKIKLAGLAGLVGVVILRDYDNLPSTFVRVLNEAALNALLARPQVKAVYRNTPYQLSFLDHRCRSRPLH